MPRTVQNCIFESVSISKPSGKNAVIPTERKEEAIIPMTAGFRQFMIPETALFFRNFSKYFTTIRMMIKDGRITPDVAHNAPNIPPFLIPIKVAILTASGPGVLSLTASAESWHILRRM